ncbi:unnamed protein product [Cochlearia groenlandica]
MHRSLIIITFLITSVVTMNQEDQYCKGMFESIIDKISTQQHSPQYCRGVTHFNNILKIKSPINLQVFKKRKEGLGKPCECMQLEVIWKIRCVRCEQDPDHSNVTNYESHIMNVM